MAKQSGKRARMANQRRAIALGGIVVLLGAIGASLAMSGEDGDPTSPTTTTADLDRVDFRNFSYPPGTCGHLKGLRMTDGSFELDPTIEVTNENGAYLYYNASVLATAAGDLDDDGGAEQLVLVGCEGGSSLDAQIQVYTRGADGLPAFVAAQPPMTCYSEPHSDYQGAEACVGAQHDGRDLTSLAIDGGEVISLASFHEGTDASCCPSTMAELHFHLSGSSLEPVAGTVLPKTLGTGGPVPGFLRGVREGWDVSAVADEALIAQLGEFGGPATHVAHRYPTDGTSPVLLEMVADYQQPGRLDSALEITYTTVPFRVTGIQELRAPTQFCVSNPNGTTMHDDAASEGTVLAELPGGACGIVAADGGLRNDPYLSPFRSVTWQGNTGWIRDSGLAVDEG